MSLFYPDLLIAKITDISYDMLYKLDIKTILLDVDDTISPKGASSISKEILEWINIIKSHSVGLVILSNNSLSRVKSLSQKIEVPCICRSMKPFPWSIHKAMKLVSADKSKTAIIGDQIFTDVLAAKLSGIKSILVEPMDMDGDFMLKFKRKLECLIKSRWSKQ